MGEVIKHGLIKDAAYYEWLLENAADRKKRRRNLQEGNAAQMGRRRESAEIAHNSAAECCQHIVAVKMVQNQRLI